MLFNSLAFAFFLPAVFISYWALSRSRALQNTLLMVASYVFYAYWDYRFLSLIVISSSVDYVVGRSLATSRGRGRRRAWLGLSIATNIGLLGVFKYFNFFSDTFARLLESFGFRADLATIELLLPVGISFYTFQTLGYTIDVYREKVDPTRDVLAFFAFVSFFPQLVAGPIERAGTLLSQFLAPRSFDTGLAKDGLRQMLWGLFKKMVVADNIAPHVEPIFADGAAYNAPVLWLAVVLFAFQIYCDFSGYSDIAIGTARLFGFKLMRNFAYPYFSRNIAEFWRRWHISLSSWFRDYVYIPLGGSREGTVRRTANVMATFMISGLWHGADWKFVVWGMIHGLCFMPAMLLGRHKREMGSIAAGRILPSPREMLGIFTTFGIVLVAWVFFRAPSNGAAVEYLRTMLASWGASSAEIDQSWMVVLSFYILVMIGVEWLQRERSHGLAIAHLPLPLRWITYVLVVLAVLFLGNFGEIDFIYFQF